MCNKVKSTSSAQMLCFVASFARKADRFPDNLHIRPGSLSTRRQRRHWSRAHWTSIRKNR